ncbi:MAG: hypothetical protein KKB31_07830, partial [Nanoarchaeota archaeon]|nr:hypothetical protein [Nanoarchaeota archaeon]
LTYKNIFGKKVKYTKRVIESKQIEPVIGKVVGIAARREGQYNEGHSFGYNYYHGEEDYIPPYLEVSKTVYVWLVRTGMLNKAIEVLDADISLWEGRVRLFPLISKVPKINYEQDSPMATSNGGNKYIQRRIKSCKSK